jgi:putative nucleotidyltransferase with HDIG domain
MRRKITKKQLNKLITILKNIFLEYSEAGGGKGYRFSHSVRVMRYCQKFLETPFFKTLKLDKDAVLVAALFHDIGKIKAANLKKEIKYNSYGDRHHEEIGSSMVQNFLKKVTKNVDFQMKIGEIIKDLKEKEPKFLETRLIKDVDLLDNYGVIKIWRSITYAQYQNRQIERVYEYWEEEGREKALKELSFFHFKPIKSLALKRFKKLDKLIKEIKIENLGLDIK